MAASGRVWDAGRLAHFFKAPTSIVPGTEMAFPGFAREAEIDDAIAYLKTIRPDGKAVPWQEIRLSSPDLVSQARAATERVRRRIAKRFGGGDMMPRALAG